MSLRRLGALRKHRTVLLIPLAFALATAGIWVLTASVGWGLISAAVSVLVIEGLSE